MLKIRSSWHFACLLMMHQVVLLGQTTQSPGPIWHAQWIQPASDASPRAYGVYHFRKTFRLEAVPERFVVHMSADQRYKCYVNGQEVGLGPARGDTQHWYYDTYDLVPFLREGLNSVAVLVWNMSDYTPVSQVSHQTGLLLEGDAPEASWLKTDTSWRVWHNRAYQPLPNDNNKLWTYIVVGAGDRVDGTLYPWGWEQPDFVDKEWPHARSYGFPAKMRGYGSDGNWAMVPRTIPPMWSCPERLATVRRIEGDSVVVPDRFLAGQVPLQVAPNKHTTILFDQAHLTNGYPQLLVSGGRGATIRVSYAEGLMDERRQKTHRDSINGLRLIGFEDEYLLSGGQNLRYVPLWFRTWRYLQLDITTQDEPLIINDLYSVFTGYPLQENARYTSSDPSHQRIWDAGWRTARLCAGETYYDCPYYEQLQYTGDTRIQALISLYVSGDDRLVRKAIQDFADSRISDGLTQSRYPSNDLQVIPPFSLFWVSMVHDYWRHRSDDAFIQQQLNTIESVMEWHISRLGPDRLNGRLEWWNFTDWAWPWSEADRIGGVPPGASGGSAILSLQQVYTLRQAADLMAHYGRPEVALRYRKTAEEIRKAVQDKCWNSGRGLLSDTPGGQTWSQHANIWGVLTHAVPDEQRRQVMQKVMNDPTLTQATLYFRFYMFEALYEAGMGDAYLNQLGPWQTMLDLGLTTFAEQADPTRSDCHAWSASPNYWFLSLVCGIKPGTLGFKSVVISPNLGTLKFVEASMPHPAGTLSVLFVPQENGRLSGHVTLPEGVAGTLRWGAEVMVLKSGRNELK
jgi:alpha-L-rhamnosidase